MDHLDPEQLVRKVESDEVTLEAAARGKRVRDREIWDEIASAHARQQDRDLDVRVYADHRDVHGRQSGCGRFDCFVGDELERLRHLPVVRNRIAEIDREPLDLFVGSGDQHVKEPLEMGLPKLGLLPVGVLGPAGPEVEDRVGMNVVDAYAGAGNEPAAPIGKTTRGSQVLLKAVDVAGSPRPGLAMSPVHAPLFVVRLVWLMPVANVDHVQDAPLRAREPNADGGLEEEPERPLTE